MSKSDVIEAEGIVGEKLPSKLFSVELDDAYNFLLPLHYSEPYIKRRKSNSL